MNNTYCDLLTCRFGGLRSTLSLTLLFLYGACLAFGQDTSGGITRAQADAILDELRQIRQLLQSQAKPVVAPVLPQKRSMKLQGDYTLGAENAPLTMVEFTDYQCPFCRGFKEETFDQIRKLYIDTGMLRFVSRNLPLEMHKDAMRSAESAMCAGDQGQYWTMRDRLFQSPELSGDAILSMAKDLKLDIEAFQSCVDGEKHKSEIFRDAQEAQALNMAGTPAFLIGKSTDYGVEGYVIIGALPFAQFDAKLKGSDVQ